MAIQSVGQKPADPHRGAWGTIRQSVSQCYVSVRAFLAACCGQGIPCPPPPPGTLEMLQQWMGSAFRLQPPPLDMCFPPISPISSEPYPPSTKSGGESSNRGSQLTDCPSPQNEIVETFSPPSGEQWVGIRTPSPLPSVEMGRSGGKKRFEWFKNGTGS